MSSYAPIAQSILVFDSGLGGLSVVGHLRAALKDRALTYICDHAALPYGTKADAWLVQRILQVCKAAVARTQARALVLACNTASTLALEALREQHRDIPVIGTVPAIKPAACITRSGVMGLLATSATVRRAYTDRLIRDFAPDKHVVRVAADPLVQQAERLLCGSEPEHDVIAHCISPLLDNEVLDTVVLGCTHFPLLRPYFETLSTRPIQWIDSGAAIAQRALAIVPQSAQRTTAMDACLSTSPDMPGLAKAMANYGFAEPILLDMPPGILSET